MKSRMNEQLSISADELRALAEMSREANREIAALKLQRAGLLSAAKKTAAFLDDLSSSNPGYMKNLCLQNYAQWNEAMIELPQAIKFAERKV